MSETSIEKWEKKAQEGLLFGNSLIRDLSLDLNGVFTDLIRENTGKMGDKALKKMGFAFSGDLYNGGKIQFDRKTFEAALKKEPEKIERLFTGDKRTKTKGLAEIIESKLTPYATRFASKNGHSYGRLVEEAGLEKIPLSITKNVLYKEREEINKRIAGLKQNLKMEQDRYIKDFTEMESIISHMNAQSEFLNSL